MLSTSPHTATPANGKSTARAAGGMASQSAAREDAQEGRAKAQQRRVTREALRSTTEYLHEHHESIRDPSSSRLRDAVRRSDATFVENEEVFRVRELGMDGGNMAVMTDAANAQASHMNTFLKESKVLEALQAAYGPSRVDRDAQVGSRGEAPFDWAGLGSNMSALWRGGPVLDPLLGTLTGLEVELETQQGKLAGRGKAPRTPRLSAPKMASGGAAAPTLVTGGTTADKDGAAVARRAQGLARRLGELLRDAPLVRTIGGRAVRALGLVQTLFNPWSFTQTVENLFLLADLVKKRSAAVSTDSAGNAIVTYGLARAVEGTGAPPPKRSRRGGSAAPSTPPSSPTDLEPRQFAWTLDRPSWRVACEVYGVNRPALPHLDSTDDSAPPGEARQTFYGGLSHRQGGGTEPRAGTPETPSAAGALPAPLPDLPFLSADMDTESESSGESTDGEAALPLPGRKSTRGTKRRRS